MILNLTLKHTMVLSANLRFEWKQDEFGNCMPDDEAIQSVAHHFFSDRRKQFLIKYSNYLWHL